jgi:hypothetical protein
MSAHKFILQIRRYSKHMANNQLCLDPTIDSTTGNAEIMLSLYCMWISYHTWELGPIQIASQTGYY